MSSQAIRFENFELHNDSFELRREGSLVELEPQEFSILRFLVAQRGELVSKEALLDEVWGHQYVTDAAIATRIKGIRKALDDDGQQQRLIQTVRGRGFRFVGELLDVEPAPSRPAAARVLTNLPRERTPMFGRADLVERCSLNLRQHRLVSLLGIGGSGKTRLAIAVGRSLLERFADGIWFVDLVPCRQLDQVATAIADAVGVAVTGSDQIAALAQALAGRRLLVVVDNCEHVIDQVAMVIDRLLDATEHVHIVATSRVPLELRDEVRIPVGALPTDPQADHEAPAVAMFQTCAARMGSIVQPREVELVRDVCRHLDGIPLAIDLAAAQLRYLSVADLAARLDRRFELLVDPGDARPDRVGSLLAVLEDTYALLSAAERDLLAQLAVFPGTFDFAAVDGVLGAEVPDLVVLFAGLVDRALLTRTEDDARRWRLLETVRVFVTERCDEQTLQQCRANHAAWVLDAFDVPLAESFFHFAQSWWCIDHFADLRAAEQFLYDCGRYDDGAQLLIRQSLAMLQDLGPRAISMLPRLERYPPVLTDPALLTKIHGAGVFFARGAGDFARMADHSVQALAVGRDASDEYTRGFSRFMGIWTRLAEPSTMQKLDEIESIDWHDSDASRDAIALFRGYVLANQDRWDEVMQLLTPLVERVLQEPPESITYASSTAVGLWGLSQLFKDPSRALAAMQQKDCGQPEPLLETTLFYLRALVAAAAGEIANVVELCEHTRARQSRARYSYASEVLLPCVLVAHALDDHAAARNWLSHALPAGGTTNLLPLGAARVCSLYPDVTESGAPTARRNEVADEALAWLSERAARC